MSTERWCQVREEKIFSHCRVNYSCSLSTKYFITMLWSFHFIFDWINNEIICNMQRCDQKSENKEYSLKLISSYYYSISLTCLHTLSHMNAQWVSCKKTIIFAFHLTNDLTHTHRRLSNKSYWNMLWKTLALNSHKMTPKRETFLFAWDSKNNKIADIYRNIWSIESHTKRRIRAISFHFNMEKFYECALNLQTHQTALRRRINLYRGQINLWCVIKVKNKYLLKELMTRMMSVKWHRLRDWMETRTFFYAECIIKIIDVNILDYEVLCTMKFYSAS